MATWNKRPESTWRRMRMVVSPSEMQASDARMLTNEEFGILMRLIAGAMFCGVPTAFSDMARVAGFMSTRRLKRLWPRLEPFFEPSVDGKRWVLRENGWLLQQIISAERRNLTAVLDALVDYWGPRCAYCGAEGELEVEHIVPLARGGTNEITNLTVACRTCNAQKRTQTAEEFGYPEVHHKAARIQ